VIRTRSTAGMPFLPLILVLCASLSWLCFGLVICDVPIIIPTALGALCGVVQISLWMWVRGYERRHPAEDMLAPLTPTPPVPV
jgi:hypothetical protein